MIWFSADYHLAHKNIIKYCGRPFADVEKMDSTIINNLRSKVKKGDTLYFLGDLSFRTESVKNFFEHFSDLEIHFIIGNHDNRKCLSIAKKNCASVSHLKDIVIKEQPITLCHYAMRVWNRSHFNSWQLYGHSVYGQSPVVCIYRTHDAAK